MFTTDDIKLSSDPKLNWVGSDPTYQIEGFFTLPEGAPTSFVFVQKNEKQPNGSNSDAHDNDD